MMFYVHSIEGKPVGEWQPCPCGGRQALDEHWLNVAGLFEDGCLEGN